MGVFILMYVILYLAWWIFESFPKNKRNLIVCIVCCIVLWSIQAFRGLSIGTDLINYIPFFKISGNAVYRENTTEIGFFYLNSWINKYLTTNASVFLSIVSALFLIPISIVIKRYSKNPALSFIILASFVIYIFSFSALRQSIAIGFTTLSYLFVEKKKPLYFLGLVFVASLFHTSAIIFTLVYPLCNWVNMTKMKYFISFCIGIVLLFSLKSVLNYIIPLIISDSPDKYMSYYSDDVTAAYNLAILIFLFFISTFFIKNPDKTDSNMQVLLFCAFWCQTLGLISSVAPRIGFYFFTFIGIALSNVAEKYSYIKANRILASFLLSVFMVWFFFSRYTNGYLDVIPYKFIWD